MVIFLHGVLYIMLPALLSDNFKTRDNDYYYKDFTSLSLQQEKKEIGKDKDREDQVKGTIIRLFR